MGQPSTVPARDGAETTSPTSSEGSPAVSVRELTKSYGDVVAVDGVSFDVEAGTVVGLLGPNGAGKTTLIKSMLGLVVPTSGTARVDGIDVHTDPTAAYGRVGAMLEGARNVYWRLSVRENLEFFAGLAGHRPTEVRERHDRLLDQFGLAEKADVAVNDLSRGMKQKVALACTLSRDVRVAFLDEPTLGLDVESSMDLRRELRRLTEQEEMTVVLSSHDMDVVEDVCDRVVVVNEGSVVADDTVRNLVDLFRSKRYRFTLDSLPSRATRERLSSTYDVATDEWETVGDTVEFETALSDGERLHALLGDLLAAGCAVHDVTSVDPDLEDAFLRLTEREV
ncbi:ABC-2 type transport system ATP-binding protein [Halogranum amylolyticum]|uniref:ABC-2 type transport system ATP-binding protein n=1 Tax=Halogranum amylolyticum TaxID=660520 RepID=A0A1H8U1P2_9EURY|nr:ABC transporter ATP-binding protein [Halogranum amylolyticum]SEO97190.1 ABC-2 type transport system ATP-binding protein [Halogranum amylolyticum]